jgi:hypothetical protein
MSEGCFVWATPTQLRGGHYSINADNSLRGANTTEYRCGIRTRLVYYRKKWGTIDFQIFKYVSTSVDYRNRCLPSPNEYSLEPRGSRTNVQPVLPIRSNHCSLRTALHYFLRDDPFLKYLTRAFCY